MAQLGRPSTISAPAGQDEQGRTWTVSERLVSRIAAGLTLTDATRDAGIAEETLRSWRLKGAAARAKTERGGTLTEREAEYVRFLGDFESAQATSKATMLGVIRQVGSSPAITKTIRVKKARERIVAANGSVTFGELIEVERHEEITERPGPWTALAWILERRYPDEFGRRLAVDVPDGGEGRSPEDRAAALSEQLEEYLRAQDEANANEPGAVTPGA